MERVLSNLDTLCLIFDNVDSPKTLSGCVRVCRTWFEPAARILWRTLEDMKVLFRLLPLNWRENNGVIKNTFIDGDFWARFNVYAKHVKFVKDNRALNLFDRHNIWGILPYRSSGLECLLPNLQSLQIRSDKVSLLYSSRLLRKEISKLHLEIPYNRDNLHDLSKIILPQAPNLTTLALDIRFEGTNDTTRFSDDFSRALRGLMSLECFLIENLPLTLEIIISLAKLPKLRFFFSNMEETTGMATDDLDVRNLVHELEFTVLFPSLKTLRNNSYTFTRALPLAPLQALRNIKVIFQRSICRDKLQDTLQKIATRQKLLWHMEITFRVYQGVQFESLRPLSNFRNLMDLSISGLDSFIVTDSDMDILTQNWPVLQTFSLGCAFRTKSYLTLSVLSSFMIHCLLIKSLTIQLDASILPNHQIDLTPASYLDKIDFLYSPISDPDAVALYLSSFFAQKSFSLEFYGSNNRIPLNATVEEKQFCDINGKKWERATETLNIIFKALDRDRRAREY